MTPRNAAAAARVAPTTRRAAGPARPALRPVAPKPHVQRRPTAPPARRRGWLNPVTAAVGIVVLSLLVVVGGNMVLAQRQLHLEVVQTQLVNEESSYAAQLALVTAADSPANVASRSVDLHLVQPSQLLTIQSVPLMKRLGPPVFSSAPCCAVTPAR